MPLEGNLRGTGPSGSRDDRVLPATRATSWLVTPILLAAGVILFFFPGDTAHLWSWEIGSRMTSLTIGAGYLAGSTFFLRAALATQWHRVAIGFAGASVLATALLVATLLHWEAFTHSHVSFWAWLALYLVTPVLLPVLLVANQRRAPLPGAHEERRVPDAPAVALGVVGVVQLALAALLFAVPSLFVDVWPWPLTPLTARTVAAFFAFIGVLWSAFLVERRWSALEVPAQSAGLGLVLVAVAGARALGELDAPAASLAAFVAALAGTLAVLTWLQVTMARAAPASGT